MKVICFHKFKFKYNIGYIWQTLAFQKFYHLNGICLIFLALIKWKVFQKYLAVFEILLWCILITNTNTWCCQTSKYKYFKMYLNTTKYKYSVFDPSLLLMYHPILVHFDIPTCLCTMYMYITFFIILNTCTCSYLF